MTDTLPEEKSQDLFCDRKAPVTADLDHVLPGIGLWGAENTDQHLIHRKPGGIHELPPMDRIRGLCVELLIPVRSKERLDRLKGTGPAHADHRDSTLSDWSRNGSYRIFEFEFGHIFPRI